MFQILSLVGLDLVVGPGLRWTWCTPGVGHQPPVVDEVSEIVDGADKMNMVEKLAEETTKSVNSLIEEAVINVEEPVSVVDAPKAAAEPVAKVPTPKVNSIPKELIRSESTKSPG